MKNISLLVSLVLVCQLIGLAKAQDKPLVAVPKLSPPPRTFNEPLDVTLSCPTPGATIRYTLNGTNPTAAGGIVYNAPLHVDKTTTLVAVATKDGLGASSPAIGTYLDQASSGLGLHSLHVGNSLTNTTGQFALLARTAGYPHEYRSVTMGGALTMKVWNERVAPPTDDWQKALASLPKIDHFTVQPRDFDIAREADHDIRFFNVIRAKSPDMQPWLYIEWVEKLRQRPTDKGLVPSSQMTTLLPALTWEESMSAMLLYGEELQLKIGESYTEGKRPRIIPACLAMGWIHNLITQGKLPGAASDAFYPLLFRDAVHPNVNGAYLVDLTWFAAFYRQSPEGKILPAGTSLTSQQAAIMQRLAWDVIRNYPDCGLYESGDKPVGKPEFSPPPKSIADVTPVTLSSSTPEAWFRYTLDGTTPTRTRGYVYCGVISMRPGLTLKAVAYKSGMADSPVAEATFPSSK